MILLYTDLQGKGFSVVLSDMCPAVSGITTKDAALSIELGMQALSLAVGQSVLPTLGDCHEELPEGPASDANDGGVLLPGGNLVIKLLESEDVQGGKLFWRNYVILTFTSLHFLKKKTCFSRSSSLH